MTHAHVITGSFGSGKTTAIRRLMAGKPEQEPWMVILNEFTDAGLDALSIAEVARGQFDVRLVAGGCLCCVGELEFNKQLRDILRHFKPSRLLIEPSGAGHAADIVDTLAQYEAQKALVLDSVICLVDALDAARIRASRAANEWSQIQSADVLLLSKPDLAGDAEREAFTEIAAAQYPLKSYLGSCLNGELPPESLEHFTRAAGFSQIRGTAASATQTTAFAIGGLTGSETQVEQLGLWAVNWILPRELMFSRTVIEPRLNWLLDAYPGRCRLKAVLRTGPGPSWLIQSHGRGLSGEDSAYRRDSRIEMVFSAAPSAEFFDQCRTLLRDAAFVR
jgi:G3E family GTPase